MNICPKADKECCIISDLLCDQAVPHDCKDLKCDEQTFCYRLQEEIPCVEVEDESNDK